MTTWKLLDELGGHSVAVIHKGVGDKPWDVVVDLGDQSFPAQLPATVFTTEEPPLPEEPPVGTVLLDAYGHAWQHMAGESRGDWLSTNDDAGDDWQNLNEIYSPLTLLAPAPEPMALPWSDANTGLVKVVRESGDLVTRVYLGGQYVAVNDAAAREMARALNTAADKAEAEATS